jgi:hypothetical protein
MAQDDVCSDDGSVLQTLHDQVYAGPGVAGVEPAAAALSALAPWIGSSSDRLRDALRRGGVSWSGQAADAATSALHRAGEWADNAGQATHTAAASVQTFAESFAHMKPKIIPPTPVPPLTVWDGLLGVLSPSRTDHATIVQDNANSTEVALAAYSTHESITHDAIDTIPATNPTPQITNPSATPPAPLAPMNRSRTAQIPHVTTPPADRATPRTSRVPTGTSTPVGHTRNANPSGTGHIPAPARSGVTPGGTTPTGWAPPDPRTPMDPSGPPGQSAPNRDLPGGLPPGGLIAPGGGLGVGAQPAPSDSVPGYRLARRSGDPAQTPPERTLTGAPAPVSEDTALTGRPGGAQGTGGAGAGRPPLPPPLGSLGTRHRSRQPHRRNDGGEVPLYDPLFGIDDLTDGVAPAVIGLDRPQP